MDTTKENLNGSKERLSDLEYRWAVALVYTICISINARIFYDIDGSSDSIFDPKNSYYMWLVGLIAALLSNLLFNPKGRSAGYFIIETWQGFPKFLKAIFKARFFGAFYNAVLGSRLRDFYMALLTMPFIAAIHEISAYCGHPSNFLVEGLVMLGFLVCFGLCSRLCAKLGW
ncbi:hypothetical protein KVK55_03625 [Helicobacter pylori]|nr:hypothetical protein KVK55_03625 [Helicobacter pylori]